MPNNYDFSGWATKAGIKCKDGRTIMKNAFAHNDGKTVPLVFNHIHDDISNVVGHAVLEARPEGIYTYGYLNGTSSGKDAKEQLRHGDIKYLSIYANHLTERSNGEVLHGDIKEVSLVLAGANPGAMIDVPYIEHGEDMDDFEGIIYTDEELYLAHSEDDGKKKKKRPPFEEEDTEDEDIDDEEDEDIDSNEPTSESDEDETEDDEEEEKKRKKTMKHSDNEKTVQDVVNTMNEEQKKALFFIISQLSNDDKKEEGEEDDMKHNVFDADTRQGGYLSHDDMAQIFADAKRIGSLKDAVEEHQIDGVLAHDDDDMPDPMTATYGIDRIDWLFPEAKMVTGMPPEFIKRKTEWVSDVMGNVHKTPFSRIKSMYANITMDEARAKGYLKGHLKKEEVFTLLRRTTDPQTIYKKQKLDRDDIIDITDFDVVSWIKSEMRMMLDEELARAFLVGDGRSTADEDHISHDHIRPIYTDKALYSIRVDVPKGGDNMETAKNMIDAAIRGRKEYKGSGQPTLYTTEDWVTEMLLLEDGIGHKLYKSEQELATTMRVSKIVTVPVMENQSYDNKDLCGIIVNLKDYNVGADKGGAVNMFDDFDIDYNQYKYLIETRCSGALIRPYSAMVLEVARS